MATSAHRVPPSSAEQNRQIGLALLVSLLLHTPLFLSLGDWHRGPPRETIAPALHVHIEARVPEEPAPKEAEEDIRREDAPPDVEELLAGTSRADESPEPGLAPAGRIDERIMDIAPRLQPPDVPVPSELPALDSGFVAAAMEDVSDGLTSTEPDLADQPVPPTGAVLATVAPAQTAVLTRRLEREARELLHSAALRRNFTFEDEDREFTAVLTREPAVDATGIERMTVEVTTELGGERVYTSMHMRRLAFSHFTHLVDRWDPHVQLHDDQIDGRFHTNSEILLTYDHKIAPRLLGKVTTTRGIRITGEQGWRRRSEIFVGGLATRSPRIRLPKISLPLSPHEHAAPNADVQAVSSDALIVFHADGGYDCVEVASRAEERRRLATGRATYIMGMHNAALYVRGVVNGNVTVYSPERIVVQGDLTYAQGPRTGGEADPYLGLVSDGTIEIDRADVTGPGDLEIHAAVYARERFIVRNTRARRGGTLYIYGSLTAGSISETEPRYATRIEFDPRFEHTRPPGFPETDRYEIETWDGRWRTAETLVRE